MDLSISAGLNAAYSEMGSGSIPASSSSMYTGVTDDAEPKRTYPSSLMPATHEQTIGYSRNQMWGSLLSQEDQGIQLPSFMSSLYLTSPLKHTLLTLDIPRLQPKTLYSGLDFASLAAPNLKASQAESVASSLQYSTYTGNPNQIFATSQQKKKMFSMNVNAPSYNPGAAPLSSYDSVLSPSDAMSFMGKTHVATPTHVKLPQSIQGELSLDELSDNEKVEKLKLELMFKNQVNRSFSDKFKLLKVEDDNESAKSPGNHQMTMPSHYFQLFRDLTNTLNERTQELEDTKSRLEAIIVGLVMTKDSSVSTYGTFDAQELAHRITNKLSLLQAENEALLSMVSFSNKQSLLIEMGLVKSENKQMRDKLKELGHEQ